MLLLNKQSPIYYIYPSIKYVQFFDDIYFILGHCGTLFIYKGNHLFYEIMDVKSFTYHNNKVIYITDETYIFNMEDESYSKLPVVLTQIFTFQDQILGYKNGEISLIHSSTNKFIKRSFFCDGLFSTSENILASNKGNIYVLDLNLNFLKCLELNVKSLIANNKFITQIAGSNINFYSYSGKLIFTHKYKTEFDLFAMADKYAIIKNKDICTIFEICNKQLKHVKTLTFSNDVNLVLQDEILFVFDANNFTKINLNGFKSEILLMKFERVYLISDFYFGINSGSIYFSNGESINTQCDSIIVTITSEFIILGSENKVFIISKQFPLRYKIIDFHRLLNIEEEYIVYENDGKYNVYYYEGHEKILDLVGNYKKLREFQTEWHYIDNEDKYLSYSEAKDFTYMNNKLYLIFHDCVKIFNEGELIGDILIEYENYCIATEYILFSHFNNVTIISDGVNHFEIQPDDIYLSGNYICMLNDNRFNFLKSMENCREEDINLKIKEDLTDRNVNIVSLCEDTERLALKAKELVKNASNLAKRSMWGWFFK